MTLNGRALSRSTYSQLLHVIGVSCGEGDHIDTFNICDLRGRTVIGAGQGDGGLTNRKLAEVAGVEQAVVGFRMQTCGQGGATCKNQEPLYVDVMQPYVALNAFVYGGVLPGPGDPHKR